MSSVGKNELLAWLATESGQPCRSLEDLKSGTIMLAVLAKIFPRLAERRFRVKWQPRFDWEHGLNWEAIAQMCTTLKLPAELIDRSGLQACRFKPIYHLLVALYFFRHVSLDRDFVADFAHPIDGSLATFLQSRAAIESMVLGGAINRTNASIESSVDTTPRKAGSATPRGALASASPRSTAPRTPRQDGEPTPSRAAPFSGRKPGDAAALAASVDGSPPSVTPTASAAHPPPTLREGLASLSRAAPLAPRGSQPFSGAAGEGGSDGVMVVVDDAGDSGGFGDGSVERGNAPLGSLGAAAQHAYATIAETRAAELHAALDVMEAALASERDGGGDVAGGVAEVDGGADGADGVLAHELARLRRRAALCSELAVRQRLLADALRTDSGSGGSGGGGGGGGSRGGSRMDGATAAERALAVGQIEAEIEAWERLAKPAAASPPPAAAAAVAPTPEPSGAAAAGAPAAVAAAADGDGATVANAVATAHAVAQLQMGMHLERLEARRHVTMLVGRCNALQAALQKSQAEVRRLRHAMQLPNGGASPARARAAAGGGGALPPSRDASSGSATYYVESGDADEEEGLEAEVDTTGAAATAAAAVVPVGALPPSRGGSNTYWVEQEEATEEVAAAAKAAKVAARGVASPPLALGMLHPSRTNTSGSEIYWVEPEAGEVEAAAVAAAVAAASALLRHPVTAQRSPERARLSGVLMPSRSGSSTYYVDSGVVDRDEAAAEAVPAGALPPSRGGSNTYWVEQEEAAEGGAGAAGPAMAAAVLCDGVGHDAAGENGLARAVLADTLPPSRGHSGSSTYYVDEGEGEDAEARAEAEAPPAAPEGALLPSHDGSTTYYVDDDDGADASAPIASGAGPPPACAADAPAPTVAACLPAASAPAAKQEPPLAEAAVPPAAEPSACALTTGAASASASSISSISCRLLVYGEPKLVTFDADLSRDTPEALALEMVRELGLKEDAATLLEIERQIGVALRSGGDWSPATQVASDAGS